MSVQSDVFDAARTRPGSQNDWFVLSYGPPNELCISQHIGEAAVLKIAMDNIAAVRRSCQSLHST
jgi:hypothetical protein